MSTRSPLGLLVVAGLAVPALAQSWSAQPTLPAVSFGMAGDLLAQDLQGLVGFDEVLGQTVLGSGIAWVTLPAAISRRAFSTLGSSGQRVFLFGGLDVGTGQPRNDIWRFDRSLADWQMLIASSPAPSAPVARLGCKAAPYGDNAPLVFFGGTDLVGLPNDTWILLPYGTPPLWIQLPTPLSPSGRVRHAMATGPGQAVVLFGGDNGARLGDTWVFQGAAWSQHTGVGPPASPDCRMAYDSGRDMTVLTHANGETWEWNGFAWRRVGATGAPAWANPALVFALGAFAPGLGNAVVAVQQAPGGSAVYRYTPSPAEYQITSDSICFASGFQGLGLDAFQRSLPILGQSFHLRATGVPAASLLFGAYELAGLVPISIPLPCGCMLGVTGAGPVQFVPNVVGPRDWLLPIANIPVLVGALVDVQGFVLDSANPCYIMTTQRGTLVPGL